MLRGIILVLDLDPDLPNCYSFPSLLFGPNARYPEELDHRWEPHRTSIGMAPVGTSGQARTSQRASDSILGTQCGTLRRTGQDHWGTNARREMALG